VTIDFRRQICSFNFNSKQAVVRSKTQIQEQETQCCDAAPFQRQGGVCSAIPTARLGQVGSMNRIGGNSGVYFLDLCSNTHTATIVINRVIFSIHMKLVPVGSMGSTYSQQVSQP
jgi:hypothetical protein